MRPRRHHHDARSWPSGRAEVELFTFWESDLTSDRSTAAQASVSGAGPPTEGGRQEPGPGSDPSTAPLWWALGLVLLFLVVALLG
ncbi:MAG: uncharacterized protein JWR45_133 [Blastococcus sp.]|jgi:hypothetical protein|nr:uncharacterized protein [Blastococcus sp.]